MKQSMQLLSKSDFRIVEHIDTTGKTTFYVQKGTDSDNFVQWLKHIFTLGMIPCVDWEDLMVSVVEHLDADNRYGRLMSPTGSSKEYLIAYIYAYIASENERALEAIKLPPEKNIYHYL